MDLPSSVHHTAIRLSKATGATVEPEWDGEDETWVFPINEQVKCSPAILQILDQKTCDQEDHTMKVRIVFANVKRNHGMKSWTMVKCTVQFDELEPEKIPLGLIASILSGPTNPEGDGKIGSGAHQTMGNSVLEAQRKTVIRV